MKKYIKHLSLLLTVALISGLFAGLSPVALAAPSDITDKFTDQNFRAEVYKILLKTAPEPIYDTDVKGLQGLWIAGKDIQNLAGVEYFVGLVFLNCSYNQLTSLPALPSGLKQLNCHYNQLTSLPALPSSLEELYCPCNQLTSLPTLPSGLKYLYCYDNQLTGIDASGSELRDFVCTNNNMNSTSDVTGFPDIWGGRRYRYYPQRDVQNPPALSGMSLWAKDEVTSLDKSNVIPNALRSDLNQPIRRDEFTALLVNVYEYEFAYYYDYSPFTDIEDSMYKPFIRTAHKIGLVDGTSPTTFSPNEFLTREQAAKLLYKMANIIAWVKLDNVTPNFTDNAKVSDWAAPYVAFCQEKDLMQGKGANRFDPLGNLTREEAMTVAERLIVKYGRRQMKDLPPIE